jgi:hypothetical protein
MLLFLLAFAACTPSEPSLSFTATPLLLPENSSEPVVAVTAAPPVSFGDDETWLCALPKLGEQLPEFAAIYAWQNSGYSEDHSRDILTFSFEHGDMRCAYLGQAPANIPADRALVVTGTIVADMIGEVRTYVGITYATATPADVEPEFHRLIVNLWVPSPLTEPTLAAAVEP